MQAPLILRRESAAPGNFLHLLLAIPEQRDLRADRAAIALRSFQLKFDPLVLRRHRVLVNQQRPSLIGDDHIEHAAIPQIRQRHRAPVVRIRDADCLRHIDKFPAAIVQPDVLRLIARQTAPFHRRPVLGVVDNGAVSAGNLGKVVPVAAIAIERDVAVGQIQIQRAVVVQIAELRAETPAAEFDAKIARQIFKLQLVAARSLFRHPQIISLNQHAFFGNVRDVHGVAALVEDVAKAAFIPLFGANPTPVCSPTS